MTPENSGEVSSQPHPYSSQQDHLVGSDNPRSYEQSKEDRSGQEEGSSVRGLEPVSPMRSQLESMLLVIDRPVSVDILARVLASTEEIVRSQLQAIAQEYEDRGNGFDLRETDQGWRLYTRRSNAGVVEALLLDGAQSKLSRAALETLAIIAYRQPVTRAQVAAIRGVNCDGVMRALAQRGLIRKSQLLHHYETTEAFLEQLGIESIQELPNLAPLLPDIDDIDEASI